MVRNDQRLTILGHVKNGELEVIFGADKQIFKAST